jgi:hypothetical protein
MMRGDPSKEEHVKRMAWIWMAGIGLSLGCATSAPQPAPSAPPGAVAAQGTGSELRTESGEKVICEDVQETGSRLRKQVCRTVGQDDAHREQAERTMRNMQRTGAQIGAGGGN